MLQEIILYVCVQRCMLQEIILPSQVVLTTLKYKPKTIGQPERIHRKKEQVDN